MFHRRKGRRVSNSLTSLNDIFKQIYADRLKDLIPNGVNLMSIINCHDWTVEDWIKKGAGIQDWEKYPNAIAAKKIMDSKLYKVMK